jgi:hypothetical protein
VTPVEGEARFCRRLGLWLLGGTLALQALALLGGGWPTLAPLLLAGFGLPFLVLGLLLRRDPPPGAALPRLRANPLLLAVALAAGWGVLLGTQVNATREERHETFWSFDTDLAGKPDRRRILFEFVDHPGWVSRLHSADLGDYLESLGGDRVPVVFAVTRDFGSVRCFHEVQVGERREWKDLGGGGFSRRKTGRVRGEIGPSPFE